MALTDLIPWRRTLPSSASSTIGPMMSLQREMNRMFDEMWGNGRSTQAFGGQISAFFPDVDINESDDKIELTAELPGMKDKDIKLDLSRDGDVLSIEGEKRSEVERREGEVFCSERRFGRFRRTVALPGRVDPDKVKARYQDGVLRVEMTRAPEPEQGTRRIAVKTG